MDGRNKSGHEGLGNAESESVTPISLYIDADACPVKQEIYRVAERHAGKGVALKVFVVSNSPIAVPRDEMIERVVVGAGLDAADHWIAERAKRGDIVITADVPLASRAVKAGAEVIAPNGKPFSEELIGMTLATRNLMDSAALGRRHHRRSQTLRAARPLRISLRAGPRHRAADAGGVWAALVRHPEMAAQRPSKDAAPSGPSPFEAPPA